MITEDDTALLKIYAGVHFAPGAIFIMPSGATLDADELNALTSYYAPTDGLPDRTVPAHLANRSITVTLTERARQLVEYDHLTVRLADAQKYGRQMWAVAVYFAIVAIVAMGLLLWILLARPA